MNQDPAHQRPAENALEVSIGRQVRKYRRQLSLSIAELCNMTGLSHGMVSKIENGNTSPSLNTLSALSRALNVPVTALFRAYEQQSDAVYVESGKGLNIERQGTRAGHQYQLLGHSVHSSVTVEPYLITLEEGSDVFPLFQHAGIEFLHVLSGRLRYRHGSSLYLLEPGDSLFFDANVVHGPEELVDLPIRFLAVLSRATNDAT